MRIKTISYIVFTIIILLSACNTPKVIYLQYGDGSADARGQQYEARIAPNDILDITVNSADRQASEAFNMFMPSRSESTAGGQQLQKYIVDNNGEIKFPTLGLLKVAGYTRREAEALISEKIKSNFREDPIVIVNFVDYKISVLGEVKSPGTYNISHERLNVFQALALAGDMTLYGKRDNVKILRDHADGRKEIISLNLNDRNIMYSENYYLLQNDVLYVEPTTVRSIGADTGSLTAIIFSGTTWLFSLTNLIMNLAK